MNAYTIRNARCEHLVSPLGVDVRAPRLTWIYEGENPEKRTAEIRVMLSLSEDFSTGMLWDSDWRESALTAITYGGEAFASGQRIWWRAMTRLKDQPGTLAEAVSWFETGLMESQDWHGDWIRADLDCEAPIMVRRFALDHSPQSARAYISGLGLFELFVNGALVGDEVLQPVTMAYSRQPLTHMLYPYNYQGAFRTPYLTFDLTEFLREGDNEIQVHLGNGWYHQTRRAVEGDLWYGESPILKFEARIDGMILASDQQWEWRESDVIQNNLFFGEEVDRTRGLLPLRPVCLAEAPDGPLRAQLCPSDAVTAEYPAVRALPSSDGLLLDFAQNLSGWVEVTAYAQRGDRLELRFAEEIEPAMGLYKLQFASAGGDNQIQQDAFTFSGEPAERIRPKFCWHGFRYAEVMLMREGKALPLSFENGRLMADGFRAELVSQFVTTNHRITGDFDCDNELLNWFHEASVMSLRSNQHCGVPLDCPHRERLGYTGDGQVTTPAILHNLDASAFISKWMRDIFDAQSRKSGHVPHTVPFYNGGGGPGGWGGAVVFVPWELYRFTGDAGVLREAWPHMLHWMDYLDSRSQDGIVVREEDGGWCLGDWCTPEEIRIEPALVNTALTIRMLMHMVRIAGVLELPEAAQRFQDALDQRREAFFRTFYHSDTASFGAGEQGSEALALWADAVPEAEKPRVLGKILKDLDARGGHFDTGIFATPILLDVLSENGHASEAYRLMTSTGYPSFDYMRECGATTLFEHWHPGNGSHNHGMFGAADVWLYERVAGLAQTGNSTGWTSIIFRPGAIAGVECASARVETPLGRCSIRWEREAHALSVWTEVPALSQAVLELPSGEVLTVGSGCTEWKFA